MTMVMGEGDGDGDASDSGERSYSRLDRQSLNKVLTVDISLSGIYRWIVLAYPKLVSLNSLHGFSMITHPSLSVSAPRKQKKSWKRSSWTKPSAVKLMPYLELING